MGIIHLQHLINHSHDQRIIIVRMFEAGQMVLKFLNIDRVGMGRVDIRDISQQSRLEEHQPQGKNVCFGDIRHLETVGVPRPYRRVDLRRQKKILPLDQPVYEALGQSYARSHSISQDKGFSRSQENRVHRNFSMGQSFGLQGGEGGEGFDDEVGHLLGG